MKILLFNREPGLERLVDWLHPLLRIFGSPISPQVMLLHGFKKFRRRYLEKTLKSQNDRHGVEW